MVTCPSCGEENPERARFCLACGTPLSEPVRHGEERKVVSILFVDLVGFTDRSDRADPEDVRALLRPYHERVKADIERFGGTVEKFIGDAVMAVSAPPSPTRTTPSARFAPRCGSWRRSTSCARRGSTSPSAQP